MMSWTCRPERFFGSTFRFTGAGKAGAFAGDEASGLLCALLGTTRPAAIAITEAAHVDINLANRDFHEAFTNSPASRCKALGLPGFLRFLLL
jgi:hypothetical protein